MAYIYRYQLRDFKLRSNTILTEYAEIIKSVLEKHYEKNLKDSIVEEKYFEFKLYETVSMNILQEMGRKLRSKLHFISKQYGFIRMEQTLYAVVYPSQDNFSDDVDNDIIHIEFIDSTLVDKRDQFIKRANNFFNKCKGIESIYENGYYNIEDVIKNYYIDILETYIDKRSIPELLKGKEGKRCFLVKGFHRHKGNKQLKNEKYYNNKLLLEQCYDSGYIANKKDLNVMETDQADYIEISASEEKSGQIEKIESELKLFLSETEKIDAFDKIRKKASDDKQCSYRFRVHSVGQALATSLAFDEKPPFIYFDYGMPYGQNVFGKLIFEHSGS